ncbi:PREDICTED: protein S100-A13, partial [Buceros rhinoceros silvestris]|uniref:protein S100-A13 n=1 Tax=Buceros rhinoceros silvestris TaxID=175836 RepID=UPI0005291F18
YAGKEGKKGTLTAGEFRELVQLQLPNLMKERKCGEYWRLIGELAKALRKEKAGKK